MNLLDGWLAKTIGKRLLRFCQKFPSELVSIFMKLLEALLTYTSLPSDHPYIRMELEEV